MTYPTLKDNPLSFGAGALYKDTKKIRKTFTRKDRFGEEFLMYQPVEDGVLVPRNCAPDVDFQAHSEVGYTSTLGPKKYEWSNGFVPRDDEQARMVDESELLLRSHPWQSGHIMRARTGYGKTYLGSAVIQRIGVRALVITTKEDIVDDWKEALAKTLCISPDKIGEWRGDIVPEDHHEVVVGLVQSVCKGYGRYPRSLYESFGIVVVDEVQRMGADKFSQAMWWLPARLRLGLSATPFRKDGRDELFLAHIGEIDVWTDDEELIPKVICVDTLWEPPIVWNYQTQEKGKLIIPWDRAIVAVKYLQDDYIRNQIMVRFLTTALKRGRNTVVLSDTTDHLQHIKNACREAGFDKELFGWYCGLQSGVYGKKKDGFPPPKEQREAAKVARICLATYKMCSEGTNVPWWDTCILTTPKADVEQAVGRIRRLWPDKQKPIVLDMCDYGNVVTATFAKKRQSWYESIGAEVVHK